MSSSARKPGGIARAAHLREPLDLVVIRDRHDPGNDRDRNAARTHAGDEIGIDAVVEKQLRHEEACPVCHLLLERVEIGVQARRLRMLFGIARTADAKIVFAFEQRDEIARVGEAAFDGLEGLDPRRRVAAQRKDVLDTGTLEISEERTQLVDRTSANT